MSQKIKQYIASLEIANMIFTTLAMIFTTLVMMTPAAIAPVTSDSDNVTVDITVANKTIIDISPNSFTVTGLEPGQISAVDTTFDIENLGSKPIATIEADIVDLPTTNPFETGAASNYEAGNYLALYADTSTSGDGTLSTNGADFWFVRTRNFNESDDIPRYVTNPTNGNLFAGRFRIDSEEFFFSIVPDPTSGVVGNGTLYVSDTPHNDTQIGDTDLSDNTGVTLTKSSTDDNVGSADVTLNTKGSADSYCALVNGAATPAYVDLFRWAVSADTPGGCTTGKDYILDSSEAGVTSLQPGASKGINLVIRLAYGVFQGVLSQSTLQITATSEY